MGTATKPLVEYSATPTSESVLTTLQRYRNGTYKIANFQRESDQWDKEKKSLFIESIINNLTVPSLFLAPVGAGKFDIVDGQQRITTLEEFHAKGFRLVPADEADYLPDQSAFYAGKTFGDLKTSSSPFADAFESFSLSFIILPSGLKDSTRREIFRRINEAGTPLTAQDIRLAYWGDCATVSFIRLSGVYDETRQGSKRMIDVSTADYGVEWPWKNSSQPVRDEWKTWWTDKQTSLGQTASEMFLWFLIATYLSQIDNLLSNPSYLGSGLNTTFDGRTEEAADIFCAQLKHEATNSSSPRILCSLTDLQKKLFPLFSDWWFAVHSQVPNIGVDRNRRVAILVAAFSGLGTQSGTVTANQWVLIEQFLRSPMTATAALGITVPVAKGKWGGGKGQREQIRAYQQVAQKILTM